jgi:hypothetical protein
LEGADLEDSNLQGARELTQDQIEWTIGSNKTQSPSDLDRPEWWDKRFEEQVKIVSEHIGGG